MVAQLPVALALRDALLAAGLGLVLALCYRMLRLVLGSGAVACFASDVAVFVLGAVVYRAAAIGLFAGGQLRWYTVGSLLAAYAVAQANFFAIFFLLERGIRLVVAAPFLHVWHYILCPVLQRRKEKAKKKQKPRSRRGKTAPPTQEKDLQSDQRVLYNSNI